MYGSDMKFWNLQPEHWVAYGTKTMRYFSIDEDEEVKPSKQLKKEETQEDAVEVLQTLKEICSCSSWHELI